MDVKSYQKGFLAQKKSTTQAIENRGNLVRWKSHMEIADIGCGEGTTTINILKPFITKNTSSYKIQALDFSEEMLKTAKETFLGEENVVFDYIDIGKEDLDEKYKKKFDLVVSFFCLHQVANYKNWINNVYDMLKPGGQIFIVTAAKLYISEEYDKLLKEPKWIKYYKDIPFFNSPLIFMDNGGYFIEDNLKKQGFKNVFFEESQVDLQVETDYMKKFLRAFPGLLRDIPEQLKEEFLDELASNAFKRIIINEDSTFIFSSNYFVYIGDK